MSAPFVVYAPAEASVSLYFEGLPAAWPVRWLVSEPTSVADDVAWLRSARAVVLVRGFERAYEQGVLEVCDDASVPVFLFWDDDLIALGAEQRSFASYTPAAVRRFLRRCRGLIVSSPALADVARASRLTDEIVVWGCVDDPRLASTAPSASDAQGGSDAPVVVGVVGGPFRRPAYEALVWPALARVGAPGRVRVVARADLAARRGDLGQRRLPFELSFARFIATWRRERPDIIVHPPGQTTNLAGKTANILLVARYVGAVPVVADEPAYRDIPADAGVVVVRGDASAWQEALAGLLDPARRAALRARLAAYCEKAFAAERLRPACDRLAALAPASTVPGGARREASDFTALTRPSLAFMRRARRIVREARWRPAPAGAVR